MTLTCRNVTKRYRGVVALDDVSFSAPDGKVTALIGANGAGKTTALSALTGLIRLDSGTARVDEAPLASWSTPAKRLGAVYGPDVFRGSWDAQTNLRPFLTANGFSTQRASECLELVGLTAMSRKKVGAFSLGMRQRLALAAALLGDPKNLVLDEPFNGLDPDGVRWLGGFLKAQAASGTAILVSSHHLAELDAIADRVVVMRHGRVSVEENLSLLRSQSESGIEVSTPKSDSLIRLATATSWTASETSPGVVTVHGIDALALSELLAAEGIPVGEFKKTSRSLGDLYFGDTPAPDSSSPLPASRSKSRDRRKERSS